MKSQNVWKRSSILAFCAALLFLISMGVTETAQASGKESQTEQGQSMAQEGRAVSQNGFTIENGILKSYTGEAEKIVIPEGVTVIGEDAFRDCESLKEVTIPKGTVIIGEGAFRECKNLAEATIPEGVTIIGGAAFYDCIGLKNIIIPESVTGIGDAAFYGCSSLTGIKIPKNVAEIGSGAFADCDKLEELNVAADNPCYYGEDGILYDNNKNLLFCLSARMGDVNIPQWVTNIEAGAFANCKWLADVTIPGNVKNIGARAFSGSDLENVIILQGVASIGDEAFEGCALTDISIPQSVKSIGKRAFAETRGLKSIIIPEGVTSIEEGTFEDSELESIVIPDSVKSIGESAFKFCDLKSITIPESVKKIGKSAFNYWDSDFIIYGKKGSYAQKYAKKNNIAFSWIKKSQGLEVAGEYNKIYGNGSFRVNVKSETGNRKLTYTSSDTKVVTVNNSGRVTIKGTGIATITVKAGKTEKYDAVSVKVTVRVSPKQPKTLTARAQSGQKIKVGWTSDKKATGYEIQYSTDEEFKNGNATKTITVKRNRTTSTTIKQGLEKGEEYYIRIRSYRNARTGKKTQKLYSAWSKTKTVVCK